MGVLKKPTGAESQAKSINNNVATGSFFEGAQNVVINGGNFSLVTGNTVQNQVYTQDPQGVKVTIRRLYPQLDRILIKGLRLYPSFRTSGLAEPTTSLVNELRSALFTYVSNNMPIRLLQIPEMKLLERHAVAHHIASKMAAIDDDLLSQMMVAIEDLGTVRASHILDLERAMEEEEREEEDARENPWGAVCQYLFSKYAGYTILSHTWLQDNSLEISYQDALVDNWWASAPRGPGYDKLKGFVDVSRSNGATLVWIDTLCINKDSSAELDESIRSMYRWYHDASLCIVYLQKTSSLEAMGNDVWYTRGWTLQELLAPTQIKFYTKNWERLLPGSNNDKANPEVLSIIQKATGITPKELQLFSPMTGSTVAVRMTWAANRITTRAEDRVYSLMGIFGVNFPISYGEGSARAFFRLIEAIITTRPTPHIIQTLAWAGTAIPETVHTSRLIPSTPECYDKDHEYYEKDKEITENMFSFTHEPIILTHLGLRVQFLVLRAQSCKLVDYPSQKFGPFYAQLEITPSSKSSFQKVAVLLQKRFLRRPTDLSAIYDSPSDSDSGVHSFVFAIYMFEEDEKTGTIRVPCCAQAFILAIKNSNSPDTTSIHDVHPRQFSPVSKIGTREIVRLHQVEHGASEREATGSSIQVATFLKSRLHASDMKLLYLYL